MLLASTFLKQESDIEWKFARSKLYMEYIREGATLPVPFNIIPTPKSFYYLFLKLVNLFKKKKKSKKFESSSESAAAAADGGMPRSSNSNNNNNGLVKNGPKSNLPKPNQPQQDNLNAYNKRAGRKESNDGLTYIVEILFLFLSYKL